MKLFLGSEGIPRVDATRFSFLLSMVCLVFLGAGCADGGSLAVGPGPRLAERPDPEGRLDTSEVQPSDGGESLFALPLNEGDGAGFFDVCTDTVFSELRSSDGRWTASQTCDRTVVVGPNTRFERPYGYPIAFSPDSQFLLFVSEGMPVERTDRNGYPYVERQIPAMYAIRLPPPDATFGHRLMNNGLFVSHPETALAVPVSGPTAAPQDFTWRSDRIFQYSVRIPLHPGYDGLFEVDLSQESPEVRRVN